MPNVPQCLFLYLDPKDSAASSITISYIFLLNQNFVYHDMDDQHELNDSFYFFSFFVAGKLPFLTVIIFKYFSNFSTSILIFDMISTKWGIAEQYLIALFRTTNVKAGQNFIFFFIISYIDKM